MPLVATEIQQGTLYHRRAARDQKRCIGSKKQRTETRQYTTCNVFRQRRHTTSRCRHAVYGGLLDTPRNRDCRLHHQLLQRTKKVWPAKAVFSTDPVQHLLHSTLSTQRFAARTEVIRAVGGWEEEYNGWVDWNLGVRLLLHTSKVHWIKHPPLATQYLHANSITTQNDRKGLEQFHLALLATRRDIEASQHPQRKRYDRLVVYRQVLLASHIIKLARQQHNPELYQYGQQLYHEALHDNVTTPFLRIFFTSCFYFTLWGGRGTGLIAQYIIR